MHKAINLLKQDVKNLPMVGEKMQSFLYNLGCYTKLDLLFHFPTDIIDRGYSPSLKDVKNDDLITVIVEVQSYQNEKKKRYSRLPFKVICYNETGFLNLVFFNGFPDYIKKQLPIGEKRVVSGKAERYGEKIQIVHPEYIANISDLQNIKKIQANYSLSYGVTQKFLRKLIEIILKTLPQLHEWLNIEFIRKNNLPSWYDAVVSLHSPNSFKDLDILSPARKRIAYDELLSYQLALALSRKITKKKETEPLKYDNNIANKLISNLPFKLTRDQEKVISEITDDLAKKQRMVRLLQGDVGTGKTLVALITILKIIAFSDRQAALMVPTSILSIQHHQNIKSFLQQSDIELEIILLMGKDKGKVRNEKLKKIKNGEAKIIIGTHALFQKDVEYKNLSYVVIDEQHRFGVNQRMELVAKGKNTNLLLMTATPIPRTLTMTLYGDIDVSSIKEKPQEREEIETSILFQNKIGEVTDGIKRVIERGEKVYWVCPLIEESEEKEMELTATIDRYKELKKIFGNDVGLVHGKMKENEREEIMLNFKQGKLKILVATTVIEVGVDVRDATIMIVEHAERFGLSQLHQLRGRVGRGEKKSYCILIYGKKLSKIGRKRLEVLRETNDGFKISEEDLALRGQGDIIGTKQSGLPNFKTAILPDHNDLLISAHKETKYLLKDSARVFFQKKESLINLMALFGYDKIMEKFILQNQP